MNKLMACRVDASDELIKSHTGQFEAHMYEIATSRSDYMLRLARGITKFQNSRSEASGSQGAPPPNTPPQQQLQHAVPSQQQQQYFAAQQAQHARTAAMQSYAAAQSQALEQQQIYLRQQHEAQKQQQPGAGEGPGQLEQQPHHQGMQDVNREMAPSLPAGRVDMAVLFEALTVSDNLPADEKQ
jgi:hypothetical protein